jgi:hypothetical protein
MITVCAAFFMQRLDRQRRNPLIDRKISGSILLMGKLNAYQKRQILISFSIQTLSHTLINKTNMIINVGKFGKSVKKIALKTSIYSSLDSFGKWTVAFSRNCPRMNK